jgi:hypothetical protein
MVQNIEKHAVFVNQAYIFAHIVTKLQKYILAIDQFHINLFFVVSASLTYMPNNTSLKAVGVSSPFVLVFIRSLIVKILDFSTSKLINSVDYFTLTYFLL